MNSMALVTEKKKRNRQLNSKVSLANRPDLVIVLYTTLKKYVLFVSMFLFLYLLSLKHNGHLVVGQKNIQRGRQVAVLGSICQGFPF